jgi:hypothetical protein
MTTNETITLVTCRWDDQPGVEAGWYCESWDGCEFIDDSQKIRFPVQVDDYAETDVRDLREALAAAFPAAEIVIQ